MTDLAVVWDNKTSVIESVYLDGTLALTATLHGTAAVDVGDGTVKLTTAAAHGFNADGWIYITGSTNYSGLRKLVAIPAATTFTFKADYVAETPAGTETAKFVLAPQCDFELLEVRLHLSAAGANVENFTITLDSRLGSEYDVVLRTKAMNTVQDDVWAINSTTERRFFFNGDTLVFAWANAGGKTYGLEVIYKRN